MNIDIIKSHTNLSREVYRFYFSVDICKSTPTLELNQYASQYKQSKRHTKWLTNGFYDRIMTRDGTIPKPLIPDDIKMQLKAELIRMIDKIEVK